MQRILQDQQLKQGRSTDAQRVAAFYEHERIVESGLIAPRLTSLRFDPKGKVLLEIGCGLGRLFLGFSEAGFARFVGVDASKQAVEWARTLYLRQDAQFLQCDGESLVGVPDGHVDFVFCHNLFEEVGERRVVLQYLAEITRVLKPSGTVQLHFKSSTPLKRKLLLLPSPEIRRLIQMGFRALSFRWLHHKQMGQETWMEHRETLVTDVTIPKHEAQSKLYSLGYVDITILSDLSNEGVEYYWEVSRKLTT